MDVKNIKILLLEDNSDIINWVKKVAEKYQVKIEIGRNTADYLNLTKKYRFAYVLCDLSLEYTKEGFDILKIHKKRKLKSKIIAFTSENLEPDVIQSIGFDLYINKNSNNLVKFVEGLT